MKVKSRNRIFYANVEKSSQQIISSARAVGPGGGSAATPTSRSLLLGLSRGNFLEVLGYRDLL
jgi:hypothetical protein